MSDDETETTQTDPAAPAPTDPILDPSAADAPPPPPPATFGATHACIVAKGTKYLPLDRIVLAGGESTQPTIIEVLTVGDDGSIDTCHVLAPGVYTVPPAEPAAQATTSKAGTGATFGVDYKEFEPHDPEMDGFIARGLAKIRARQAVSKRGAPHWQDLLEMAEELMLHFAGDRPGRGPADGAASVGSQSADQGSSKTGADAAPPAGD